MAETIYNGFIVCMLILLTVVVFGYFIRTILGPHFADRILAINSISTVVMLFIGFLAVMQGENYIVDIALIYAVLGFVSVVILCKQYLRSHKKEKANDLKKLKEQLKIVKGEDKNV